MSLNYQTYGLPPFRIVLVHGGPGSAGEMTPVANVLSNRMSILEPFQTRHTVSDQILELKRTIEKRAKVPAVLVGFSWGAWLSILLTARYPQLVKKLILIGCPPLETNYAKKINETRMNRLNKKDRSTFISLLDMLSEDQSPNSTNLFYLLEQFIRKTDSFHPVPVEDNTQIHPELFQKIWKEAAELRASGKIRNCALSITCPVIFIHGEYDPHPVDGIAIPLTKKTMNHKMIVLKNCGHKPWIEKEAFGDFYKTLIREIENTGKHFNETHTR
ncbi:MAG: alpha/beta hydrolase [Bacteroidales bacterium]|nr:alpha/beta hydrolase [Bacteroidales bacterium]